MKRLILLFTILPILSFAQQTYVPDDNFEAYLEANGMGNGNANDNYVSTSNIIGVTILDVYNQNIADLTGIEDFTALTYLSCYSNQLTSLDVSSNTALTTLECFNNQLISLDVSDNAALEFLNCFDNQLNCFNVKNGNNTNITTFQAKNNSNLTCIEVDDPAWSTANWTPNIDPQTSFSTNCNYPSNCFSTTSILEQTNSISLYPNPTNNLITLDIEGYNGLVNVEVYDLTGKLLQTTKNTTISMGEYAKGIYVFKVAYGDGGEKLKVVKE